MKKYRSLYVSIFVIICALTAGYQSNLSIILLFAVIIVPIVSLILFIVTALTIRFQCEEKQMIINKKQKFSIMLKIKNNFIVPVTAVRVVGTILDDDGIVRDGQIIVSVPALHCFEVLFDGSLFYRGEYMIGVDYVEYTDVFHLFKLRKNLFKKTHIVVLPDKLELENIEKLKGGENNADVKTLEDDDSRMYSSVREYRREDQLKQVHWKLSAKQDNLIVRQTEQMVKSNALILCDFGEYFISESENLQALDNTIELALSLTAMFIKDNVDCTIAYAVNGLPESSLIKTSSDYEQMFMNFATITSNNELSLAGLCHKYKGNFQKYDFVYFISPQYSKALLTKLSEIAAECRQKCYISVCGKNVFSQESESFYNGNDMKLFCYSDNQIVEMIGNN